MKDTVTVTAAAEHRNRYGDEELKAPGDTYECPHAVALLLEAQELASINPPEPAPAAPPPDQAEA